VEKVRARCGKIIDQDHRLFEELQNVRFPKDSLEMGLYQYDIVVPRLPYELEKVKAKINK